MITISTVGRLTADPMMNTDLKCCNFSIACDSSKRGDGNDFITEFFRVSVWGKRAETAAKYLRKGSQVFVTGDFTSNEYVDRNGKNRTSKNIENATFQFVGSKSSGSEKPAAESSPASNDAEDDEDLPF